MHIRSELKPKTGQIMYIFISAVCEYSISIFHKMNIFQLVLRFCCQLQVLTEKSLMPTTLLPSEEQRASPC